MKLPDWGTLGGAVGKLIADWVPSKKESKQNTIDRLLRENAELQKKPTLAAKDLDRIRANAERIKQLRAEISRIGT